MILRLSALAACLALASACGGGGRPAGTPASSASHLLGQEAPTFKRTALDGGTFDLGQARGKVAVVKFVAKYCDPCTRTLPAIEALHEERPEIVVVGVSEDERESEARELIAQFRLSFPVVHDTSNVLAGRFRVRELPVTFVLDGRGTVKWVGGPEKNEAELRAAIEATRP
jgi:cytochrome c biogenesis protein CcmG/thiol:disulfide interchange protein DsbE